MSRAVKILLYMTPLLQTLIVSTLTVINARNPERSTDKRRLVSWTILLQVYAVVRKDKDSMRLHQRR
jgi:hypothetical protein